MFHVLPKTGNVISTWIFFTTRTRVRSKEMTSGSRFIFHWFRERAVQYIQYIYMYNI